ncbi:MAG: flagellar biosynthetic protein FliR [Deltaproteobacteria bacterium]|nr:flagellar biosynthetic protein FliR [Deltaproteobacteria bacterium]MBW2069716.1 flagellar biosynthetic protein FliR [Deltaproteobacteria bacterium]
MPYELLYSLLSTPRLYSFFFIFFRVSVCLFLLPFFGSVNLPTVWKASLSLLLALFLSQVVPVQPLVVQSSVQMVLMICAETLLGVVLALSVRIILAGFQIAGQFIGFQMGYSIVNVIDPQSGSQSSILAQFSYILAILIFLLINGHHLLLQAVIRSFELIPPGGFVLQAGIYAKLVKLSSIMFQVAVRISAPVMIALLLTTVALGLICKTVPQINILIVGFPLNIGIGLLIFGISMGTLVPYFSRLLKQLLPVVYGLIQSG